MQFETSDGCPIGYTLHATPGSAAPRLVLLHSLALDRGVWDGVVARLRDRADILTFDCRGHGASGRPAGPFTLELFARDLAELLDHVGWETATVAGASMGGFIAQTFAGVYPQRVAAMSLIDTTAWFGIDGPKKWQERADAARSKGLGAVVDSLISRWFSEDFRARHPETVAAAARVYLANDVDSYVATCAMLGSADLRHYLPSFRMPVAVVVGEHDDATPVAAARALHEAITTSTLSIVPNGRHLTLIECPDEVASQILTVLAPRNAREGTLR